MIRVEQKNVAASRNGVEKGPVFDSVEFVIKSIDIKSGSIMGREITPRGPVENCYQLYV